MAAALGAARRPRAGELPAKVHLELLRTHMFVAAGGDGPHLRPDARRVGWAELRGGIPVDERRGALEGLGEGDRLEHRREFRGGRPTQERDAGRTAPVASSQNSVSCGRVR